MKKEACENKHFDLLFEIPFFLEKGKKKEKEKKKKGGGGVIVMK